ncbi:CtsR family transcriptional regulator [Anaeroselena agilis]|uniref:CtsR family transcriptional regulator n=1 Tax=Anaeroselena agilis TaxID=3063788 RepID=A0ABU3P118_9FIRM|nr:CtsR family transcriptional regulator [Selenomonadales bacterium 4137-cl]
MGNLADAIENFILSRLADEEKQVAVLRRNEMADELNCAPSQISYVLSTRFTVERGFIVESRRGSGGFVRIVRIPVRQIVYEDAARQLGEVARADELERTIERLRMYGMLSDREAGIMQHFFQASGDRLDAAEKVRILRSLLRRLTDFE